MPSERAITVRSGLGGAIVAECGQRAKVGHSQRRVSSGELTAATRRPAEAAERRVTGLGR